MKFFLGFSLLCVFALNAAAFSLKICFASEESTLRLNVEFLKEKKDNRGTDTDNIYTISLKDNSMNSKGKQYHVILLVDGKAVEVIKDQRLPLELKRNFKGFAPGLHSVQVQLEDANDNVISAQAGSIHVEGMDKK